MLIIVSLFLSDRIDVTIKGTCKSVRIHVIWIYYINYSIKLYLSIDLLYKYKIQCIFSFRNNKLKWVKIISLICLNALKWCSLRLRHLRSDFVELFSYICYRLFPWAMILNDPIFDPWSKLRNFQLFRFCYTVDSSYKTILGSSEKGLLTNIVY